MKTTGIFINGTYNLSEKLSATLGIRRSTDEKTIRTSVVDIRSVGSKLAAPPTEVYDIRASEDWDATTPSFLLKYDFSPSVNLYGSVSKRLQKWWISRASTYRSCCEHSI